MQLFFQRLFDGIQNGAIYSVVAIPMVLLPISWTHHFVPLLPNHNNV